MSVYSLHYILCFTHVYNWIFGINFCFFFQMDLKLLNSDSLLEKGNNTIVKITGLQRNHLHRIMSTTLVNLKFDEVLLMKLVYSFPSKQDYSHLLTISTVFCRLEVRLGILESQRLQETTCNNYVWDLWTLQFY